jgi:hypothetical protein
MAYRFKNLSPDTDFSDLIAAINRNFQALDVEGATKTYQGASGQAALQDGLLPNGAYGSLYYDSNGMRNIVISPNLKRAGTRNGKPIIAISKDGVDVLTALGKPDGS